MHLAHISCVQRQIDFFKSDNRGIMNSRRICPGMLVADVEIWLNVVRLLWSFDITELPAEPINLDEYSGLSGRSPIPFKVRLIPRHPNVENVLDAALIYGKS